MQVHPIASELKFIVITMQDTPRLLDTDSLHPLKDIVRDAGPSIGESVTFP